MRIILDVIHEGDGSCRYEGKHIEADIGDRDLYEAQDEIAKTLDAWREAHPERCDQFGAAESDLTIEEICEILPGWAEARVVETPVCSVFV